VYDSSVAFLRRHRNSSPSRAPGAVSTTYPAKAAPRNGSHLARNPHDIAASGLDVNGDTAVSLYTATRAGGSPVKVLRPGVDQSGSPCAANAAASLLTSPVQHIQGVGEKRVRKEASTKGPKRSGAGLFVPLRPQQRSGARPMQKLDSSHGVWTHGQLLCLPGNKQDHRTHPLSTQSVGQQQSTQSTHVVDRRWQEYLSRAKEKQAGQRGGPEADMTAQHSSQASLLRPWFIAASWAGLPGTCATIHNVQSVKAHDAQSARVQYAQSAKAHDAQSARVQYAQSAKAHDAQSVKAHDAQSASV